MRRFWARTSLIALGMTDVPRLIKGGVVYLLANQSERAFLQSSSKFTEGL